MGMTVGQLTASMSEDELIEWIAYDQLDPIGNYRSDIQTALLALIQSGNADAKLDDFILFDPNPLSDEEQERQANERRIAEYKAQADAMKEFFAHLKNK